VAESTRWERVLEEAEALMSRQPDHPEAGRNAGEALIGLGRAGEGIVRLREHMVRCPHDASAHDLLAEALLRHGRHGEALEATELALAAAPGRSRATYNRARARAALGEAEEALEDLVEALRRDRTLARDADGDRSFDGLRDDPRFQGLIG
jgi:predicted Zn-dependent protease